MMQTKTLRHMLQPGQRGLVGDIMEIFQESTMVARLRTAKFSVATVRTELRRRRKAQRQARKRGRS